MKNSIQTLVGKALQVEGTDCAKSLRQELTGVIQGTERTQEEKYK